jgi:16S rRNA (adenine1518-N6/adenine1519-N6)-dimethyltransferase
MDEEGAKWAGGELPPLREIIRAAQLSARKSLGQNFLLDLNLTRRIAREAGPLAGHTILEIGPGPGGLTRALLTEGATRVIAIERDERFLPALHMVREHFPGRLEILSADALTVDYSALAAEYNLSRIVANLPYNVATPLLIGWLTAESWPPWYDRLVLMFQKEVAERLVARPNTKAYGRLSVLAQARAMPKMLLTLPARAFTPPPKVESALVELRPKPAGPSAPPIAALEQVTAAAFGQRRKMLRASLKPLGVNIGPLLLAAGVAETARAESLGIAEFCALARQYAMLREANASKGAHHLDNRTPA